MKFQVEYCETRSVILEVYAPNKDKAEDIVYAMLDNDQIEESDMSFCHDELIFIED